MSDSPDLDPEKAAPNPDESAERAEPPASDPFLIHVPAEDYLPLEPAVAAFENPPLGQSSPASRLEPQASEPELFESFTRPEIRPPVRIPHFGHLAILGVFAMFGLLGASAFILAALHFHLYGVTNQQQATIEVHYNLGSELVLYFLMLGASLLFFPLIWHKKFFAGIQWNGAIAIQLRNKLFVIAAVCCALALANGLLLPGPDNAPIEKIFKSPGAAWLLFAFGVTIAPFFEELIFRGFLLPACSTGADWIAEKVNGQTAPAHDSAGRPQWPLGATLVSLIVFGSIPAVIAVSVHYLHWIVSMYAILPYLFILSCFLIALSFRKTAPAELARPIDPNGQPLWSIPSMVIAAIFTSLPFAAMHAAQTGYAWGPFFLLVGVSLVLCWARLSTRSLAASVFVHASYNFLLFSLMMIGTGGFRHMDKM